MNLEKKSWPKVGRKIESSVRKAIADFNLFEDDAPVLVALSGGKDSITLLLMLAAISGRGIPPLKIYAAHISSEEVCGQNLPTDSIKELCNRLNIKLIIRSSKKIRHLGCYACSRIRRRALFDIAKELNIKKVAFGHQRDDNIETLLLNLFQKGEFKAILAKLQMYQYDIEIIRPLIYVKEEDIKNFVKNFPFPKKEDCLYPKNSKREYVKELIKNIEKGFPNIKKNLSTSAFLYGSKKASIPNKK